MDADLDIRTTGQSTPCRTIGASHSQLVSASNQVVQILLELLEGES
jgi:hypothetical protein